jgi:DNA polymerase/3'-5' exonuclease PolX
MHPTPPAHYIPRNTATDTLAAQLQKMEHHQAAAVAEVLVRLFAPTCDRLEVAGSVRRKKPRDIKDIELVMAPTPAPRQEDLFGDQSEKELDWEKRPNKQYALVQELHSAGVFVHRLSKEGKTHFGPRSQRLLFYPERLLRSGFRIQDTDLLKGPIAVDLFCVLPDRQFGTRLAIATGPAEFSTALVTPRHHGGLLPEGFSFMNGQQLYLRHLKEVGKGLKAYVTDLIATPEEEDVFRALGLPYLAPEERDNWEQLLLKRTP